MGKGSQNYDTEVESYSARRKLVKNASDTDSSLEKESATATRNYITWDEVKKHNKKTDCWVVVNNNVYDLTNFKKIHPGGHRVIQHYAGQDASEVFKAFHTEFDKVARYSKLYHIGIIDPTCTTTVATEAAAKADKSVKEEEKKNKKSIDEVALTKKELEMRADFEEIRQIVIDMGLFEPSRIFFVLQALQIVFFHVLSYYLLWNYGTSFFPLACAFICQVIAQGQSSWTQHDYGHSSIFKKPIHNRYAQMFFLGVVKAAGAEWWRFLHNQHHAKPNVIDKDPDVGLEPAFVVGTIGPVTRAEKNVKQHRFYLFPYSIQHYLFPFAAPLLFPTFFQLMTLRFCYNHRRYADFVTIVISFIIYFGVTMPAFNYSFFTCMLYLLATRGIESTWFAWVSQCNHISMEVHEDVTYDSWLHLQLKGTCNITKSPFNDWFTGHLNFQIEHHLFPTMPRHNLYKAQPLIQSLCKKHGIPYVIKPLGKAFFDILLSLKKSGEMWQEAYDELKLANNSSH